MDRPDKRALRTRLIARRAQLDPETRAALSSRIVARLEDLPELSQAGVVALYAPLGAEVELSGLCEKLARRAIRCLYPKVLTGGRRLVFAESRPELLVRGPLGALEPPESAPLAAPPEIECVVVPGVAFSESGMRLGRGGGFYDATLADLPKARRIAVAYDFQVLPELPNEPHDVQMDFIVTDSRTLRLSRKDR